MSNHFSCQKIQNNQFSFHGLYEMHARLQLTRYTGFRSNFYDYYFTKNVRIDAFFSCELVFGLHNINKRTLSRRWFGMSKEVWKEKKIAGEGGHSRWISMAYILVFFIIKNFFLIRICIRNRIYLEWFFWNTDFPPLLFGIDVCM